MIKNPFLLFIGIIRVILLAFAVLGGLLTIAILRVSLGRHWFIRRTGKNIVRLWCQLVAVVMGLRIHIRGRPITALRAVNHISWVDIIALNSIDTAQFVSKHDVKHWPVVGKLAEGSGTFFLRRSSPRAAKKCLHEISALLEKGHSITVFPEGTTSDGSNVLHFHGTFFQAAIDSACDIQPIALEYRRAGQRDWLAPYIHGDTFLPHMFKMVCTLRTSAIISYLEPVKAEAQDRKILARISRQQICNALLLPEMDIDSDEPASNSDPITVSD